MTMTTDTTAVPPGTGPVVAQLLAAVRALVLHPEAASVEIVDAGSVLVAVIHAAPDDIGRVIGRGGAHIRALRAVVARHRDPAGRRWLVDVAGSRARRTAAG